VLCAQRRASVRFFNAFLLATVATLAATSCKPSADAYKVASSGGGIPAERYTVKITADKTYFKISTEQAASLLENERCDLVKNDTLKYIGVMVYEGVHARLTLDELSLPNCPFRTGYLYTQHFEENSGNANTEYVYPMGAWVPTCGEAGGGSGGFAVARDGGARKHAGCDMYATVGKPIYAIEDGVVLDAYPFYCDTDAIEVKGSRVVRYGEIRSRSPSKYNVQVGQRVKKGQIIAEVGHLSCYHQPMLHFELYRGDATGSLTNASYPFKRRSDLLNPTQGLFQWRKARFPQK
jgi:murein DD-endopeptidase MepM/ murein hydrolase activator NlpD